MSHMSHSTVALVKGLDRYQNIALALGLLGKEAVSGTRQGQLWILSVNTLAIR
ncbi:MAG: hypothetical protein JRF30_01435 [Deltaproteobacteria bacterium]|nr:hypothetical protein [Deltaproteobacteria bacterium]